MPRLLRFALLVAIGILVSAWFWLAPHPQPTPTAPPPNAGPMEDGSRLTRLPPEFPGGPAVWVVIPEDRGDARHNQDAAVLRGYLQRSRRNVYQVERVLRTLGLRPGDRVAEIGPGSGMWTPDLAAAVAPQGWVLALDVDPGAVSFLRGRLGPGGDLSAVRNVRVHRVAPFFCGLPAASVDLEFLAEVHVFMDADTRTVAWLRGLRESLAPGGRLAVIESMTHPQGGTLSEQALVEAVGRGGFRLLRRHDFPPEKHFLEFR